MAGAYTVMKATVKKHSEDSDIDDDNPYLNTEFFFDTFENGKLRTQNYRKTSSYEEKIKPFIDQTLSFIGLVILSPLYVAIAAAVYIDDPGAVLFTQKRVGKNGRYFCLHKFRSMRMDAPHDIPTHQLYDPDKYITRVGRLLRKTSLDELPQLWDIFRGKMSVIGPRPALWNQEDLIAERLKYGANCAMPGLTGLAQIKGRDELEIPEKAKIDGEYVRTLHAGGLKALNQDIRCFIGTISSVLKSDGIVEGGTGAIRTDIHQKGEYQVRQMERISALDAGFEEYGCYKSFNIDKNKPKKILITGAGSYVGKSFERYAKENYPVFTIDTVDMTNGSWREYDFHGYDTVFHVAGIAHADIGKADEATKKKYYAVNTDLAIETAVKAKQAGAKQFIFMSSMIIYGECSSYREKKIIDEHTIPSPTNFYGDSKWQADKGVRALSSDTFHVVVLRAPMIYGKGSKGNYSALVKLAKYLPFFPSIENERSMLYVGNLCEFLCLMILSGESGIYFPQNAEYTNTSAFVKKIGSAAFHPIHTTKMLNPAVAAACYISEKARRLINKAFGSTIYKQSLSIYDGLDYQIIDLSTSITLTEG